MLLFVALVIGAIVAFSFGHAVNVYGYRMGQSAIKLEGNQEQFEKTDGGKFSQTSRREELSYSLTDNLEDEASKMIENSKPEFYYRFTFTDKELTKSHFYTESLLPTEDGKCERILLDGNPISPVEDTPSADPAEEIAANRENREPVVKCNYPIDFDDYFTWKITKPEEQKDWTNK
ncbi:hypothetical protein CORAM0001_1292 [Corynebacterium amycolatum SK46]|nr:hypothetical protein CORAM0001_1292 [Corynebacterium amycolatum SK46]